MVAYNIPTSKPTVKDRQIMGMMTMGSPNKLYFVRDQKIKTENRVGSKGKKLCAYLT